MQDCPVDIQLQNTGTWSAAAWLPRIIRGHHLTALYSGKEKCYDFI